jgi:hypothetical protein
MGCAGVRHRGAGAVPRGADAEAVLLEAGGPRDLPGRSPTAHVQAWAYSRACSEAFPHLAPGGLPSPQLEGPVQRSSASAQPCYGCERPSTRGGEWPLVGPAHRRRAAPEGTPEGAVAQ